MTTLPVIKICGLTSAQLAYDTAQAGADYIGLIFHPPSTRYVTPEQAGDIAAAAHEGGSQAVAVFVHHHAEEMVARCQAANITIVQLHGDQARQQASQLPDTLTRFYVRTMDDNGELIADPHFATSGFQLARDYLLFDGCQGGSGRRVDYGNALHTYRDYRAFLAGGLNAENIRQLIQHHHPYGVDLSSGVETRPGKKSLARIQAIIGLIHSSGEPLC